MLHARFYTIYKWHYCLIWFRAREYFLAKQRFINLSRVQYMDQSSMQTWTIFISKYLSVSTIISSREKLAGHCCDCFCDHFEDQGMLLVLHFQGNNVLQRTLRGFARYAFLALSYQYQMRAVEDLVADCASIASVHTLFLDLSRLGKPSEHMTVGM